MAKDINTPLLLHGIGKGILKTVDGDVLEITTAQSMTVNVTTSTEDVYGGDGLFPLFNYLTNKEGSIEITDATFKLSQLNIAQGTRVSTSGGKRLVNYKITTSSSSVSSSAITGFVAKACVGPDGIPVTLVQTGTPAANEIDIDATGTVTFGSGVTTTGEYSVWGLIDSANTITADMIKDAVCEVAEFMWSFKTEDQAGKRYMVDLHAKRVRSNGEFSIETSRDSASTPSLTVNILDPGDGDDKFMTVSITELA